MISDGKDGAIRARAYQLWIESGYADGYQEAHWRQAEREMAALEEDDSPLPLARPTMPDPRHSDGMSRFPSVLDPGPAAS